eukprot:scaffold14.g1070.t1
MGKTPSKEEGEGASEAASPPAAMPRKPRILVAFYSTYGHIYRLAEQVKAGVEAVEGVECELRQVAETLPQEVLDKMHAPPKPDVPLITPHELPEYDGFLFGMPTRYGSAPAQMKAGGRAAQPAPSRAAPALAGRAASSPTRLRRACRETPQRPLRAFFDATGSLWQRGALVGKPAGVFTSTATQNGGIETTVLTTVPFFAHQGMVFVPPSYSIGADAYGMDEVRAGSPWGAATYAGPTGERWPNDIELRWAKHQGKYFAKFSKRLALSPVEEE